MIRLELERKRFNQRDLYREFELTLNPGELLCLLGPSGCGKTTLLNLIAGLDKHFDGCVHYSTESAERPRRFGYLFQEPRLLPWRTVAENLLLVAEPARRHRIPELLEEVGLADRADSYPGALSLGMARRVALARALINDPHLLLLDEPFVSLDPPTAAGFRERLQRMRRQRPTLSLLMVTHDLQEALDLSDRILLLGGAPTRVLLEKHLDPQTRQPGDKREALHQELSDAYLRARPGWVPQEEQLTASPLAQSGTGAA